jgi:electron transport complex protein RnfB
MYLYGKRRLTLHTDPYKLLAERLDALPNGFPSTTDGVELRILAYLFTPEEALLAGQLTSTPKTSKHIASRVGRNTTQVRKQLKEMAKRGLISLERAEGDLGYKLLPFIVGFYENQGYRIDVELAQLVEDYFKKSFNKVLEVQPQFHRVIPVNETIKTGLEIRPYESATEIINTVKAWGVVDCICRKQKALIGDPCSHPVDMCMVLSSTPGAFDNSPIVRALTQQGAIDTLQRAAEVGLVHCVSNNQRGTWYICNCCTCSCGILRGIAELGLANAVARSAFVNTVNEELCIACGDCVDACQFGAMAVETVAQVNYLKCVGCGVCVVKCPEEALLLVRRPEDEVKPPPETGDDWLVARATARGIPML